MFCNPSRILARIALRSPVPAEQCIEKDPAHSYQGFFRHKMADSPGPSQKGKGPGKKGKQPLPRLPSVPQPGTSSGVQMKFDPDNHAPPPYNLPGHYQASYPVTASSAASAAPMLQASRKANTASAEQSSAPRPGSSKTPDHSSKHGEKPEAGPWKEAKEKKSKKKKKKEDKKWDQLRRLLKERKRSHKKSRKRESSSSESSSSDSDSSSSSESDSSGSYAKNTSKKKDKRSPSPAFSMQSDRMSTNSSLHGNIEDGESRHPPQSGPSRVVTGQANASRGRDIFGADQNEVQIVATVHHSNNKGTFLHFISKKYMFQREKVYRILH